MGKAKKLNATKLRKAAEAMDLAWAALEDAQYDFASTVYEAGHQDLQSFCKAMRSALDNYRGRIGISDNESKLLFGRILGSRRRSSRNSEGTNS